MEGNSLPYIVERPATAAATGPSPSAPIEPTECVVFLSGGLMSWAAGMRAVERFGPDHTRLLFTDTLIENEDLYAFLEDGARAIGAPLIKIAEGRTPWEVFRDEKIIGNTRADPCSKILKRNFSVKWLTENADPATTMLVFGIHWEEGHRLEGERWDRKLKRKVPSGVRPRYAALGWPHVWAPMCDAPWMTALGIRAWAIDCGLTISRSYRRGFLHDNCGNFCVKAGEGHFAHLYNTRPDVYAAHEAEEDAFNASRPGRRRQTVLAPERRQPGGKMKRIPMSMREFREALAAQPDQFNLLNIGGCGCFTDEAA